jgi:hypothetical protein
MPVSGRTNNCKLCRTHQGARMHGFSARSEISSQFAGRWIWSCSWALALPALRWKHRPRGQMKIEHDVRCQRIGESFYGSFCSAKASLPSDQSPLVSTKAKTRLQRMSPTCEFIGAYKNKFESLVGRFRLATGAFEFRTTWREFRPRRHKILGQRVGCRYAGIPENSTTILTGQSPACYCSRSTRHD